MTDDSFLNLRKKEFSIYILYIIYNTNPLSDRFSKNCHLSSVTKTNLRALLNSKKNRLHPRCIRVNRSPRSSLCHRFTCRRSRFPAWHPPHTLPPMRQRRRSRFPAWHLPRMCHVCATYALLRRWERLRVGERSSGMASPPTLLPMRYYRRSRFPAWHLPRMCHVCAIYALLRRWEASPPTLPPMRQFLTESRCVFNRFLLATEREIWWFQK